MVELGAVGPLKEIDVQNNNYKSVADPFCRNGYLMSFRGCYTSQWLCLLDM